MAKGEYSAQLKIAKVIALYKKGEKYNLRNYRPIRLLSCLNKLFLLCLVPVKICALYICWKIKLLLHQVNLLITSVLWFWLYKHIRHDKIDTKYQFSPVPCLNIDNAYISMNKK